MSPELKKLMVAIPVVHTSHGAPAIRVSDFSSHYDELVLSILPAEGWFVLTSRGKPICEVHRTARFARVSYRKALPERGAQRTGLEEHDKTLFVQKTDLNSRRTRVLKEAFDARGKDRVTVTFRGWPDCELRKPRQAQPVTHEPVVEPLPGQRGVKHHDDDND